MGTFDKLFEEKKVKILAGDLDAGEWEFNMNTLWGAFDQINLQGEIKSIQLQTEESVKQIAGTLGWGLAGALAFGPAGMLAGIVLGGNRKQVCALCELKDGRKFLATMDSKIYQQMLALSLAKSK
ncbi:MAG TPA: hypothetical protein V6D17_11635 [Candidatus Obscuribacterales bacterium]